MKKMYMKPLAEVVKVKLDFVLGNGSLTLNSEGGSGTPYDEGAESEGLSRFNDWDD